MNMAKAIRIKRTERRRRASLVKKELKRLEDIQRKRRYSGALFFRSFFRLNIRWHEILVAKNTMQTDPSLATAVDKSRLPNEIAVVKPVNV